MLVAGIAAAALAAAGVFEGDAPRAAAATATATATATPTRDRDGHAAAPRPPPSRRSRWAKGPDGVAVSDGQVFVANHGDGTLSTIDPETNEDRRRRSRPARARITWSPARASCGSAPPGTDTVARFENGQRDRPSVKVGDRPEAIALGKQLLWVANRNDGTVNRVDRATPSLVGSPIGVGNEPAGIFVGRRFVWVTNSEDDTVNRIDPATAQLVGDAIPTGDDAARRDRDPQRDLDRQRRGRHRDPPGPQDGQAAATRSRSARTRASSRCGFGSVWVTNHGDNTVTRIDEQTGKVDRRADHGGQKTARHRGRRGGDLGRQSRIRHRHPHPP